MKRAMQQTLKYIHAVYITDLYKDLNKQGLGTTTVVSLSRRLCSTLPKRRENTLISIIIRWKLNDAYSVLRREKYENTKIWRECKNVLIQENIMKRYLEIHNKERDIYYTALAKQ